MKLLLGLTAAVIAVSVYAVGITTLVHITVVTLSTVALIEGLVVIGMALDWFDADLPILTRGEAWRTAHLTMLRRGFRRLGWAIKGVRPVLMAAMRPTEQVRHAVPLPELAPATRVLVASTDGVVIPMPAGRRAAA